MNLNYDKKRHFMLLKYDERLKKQGKKMYYESNENFIEFRKYSIMMINYLNYENRHIYFKFIKRFLKRPLDVAPIIKRYELIQDAAVRLQSELILLEPDNEAEPFAVLFDEIVSVFDEYIDSDPSHLEDYEVSENMLKDVVREIYKEMKDNYL